MILEIRGLRVGEDLAGSWITSLNEFDSVRVLHGGSTKAIITKKHKEYVGFKEYLGFIDASLWFR